MTPHGAIILRPGKVKRRKEVEVHRRFYEALGIPIVGEITGEGTLEGGDCFWLNTSTLAIGRGFRSSENVEKASLEEIKFNYLYDDEKDYFFMNPESFDQINIKKEIVGDKGKMLTENLEVTINFHDETPLSVNLPNQIKSKIETTDAALKGQTVSSSYKPATLDNGLSIQVPPFIESGDEIIVDTRTIEYVKKV